MRSLRLLLFGLLIAVPALAGTAYVPFVAATRPTTGGTQVNFDLTNLGTVPRLGTVHFVAAGENGNAGGTDLLSLRLDPGKIYPRTCCGNASGLLILSGAPQIAYNVYLEEVFAPVPPTSVSLRLPLISGKDAVPAGSQATLLRLSGDGAGVVVSSFGILNLGHQAARCSVVGFPPYVQAQLQDIVIPPVSVAAYPDIFGRPTLGAQGSPTVTCDQPFYPFALIYRGVPGSPLSLNLPWVEFVPPAVPLGTVP
jgi:hypothetical protein